MIKEVSLLLVIIFCLLLCRNKKEFFKNINDQKIYGDIQHKKIKVKFVDKMGYGDLSSNKLTETISNLNYTKNKKKNLIYSNDKIEKNDIVLYTYTSLDKYYKDASKNILLSRETPLIERQYYTSIINNLKKYDLILTTDKKLLDINIPKIKFNSLNTTWLNPGDIKIYKKSKLCSLIKSNKKKFKGHKLRHEIKDSIIKNNLNVDLFGGSNNKYHQRPADKINFLRDYMFSITIENIKSDYYFTEKLFDCLLSGTIPIYYGCPSIHRFFDIRGIIKFDTKEECVKIIENLSVQKYNNMLPYIKKNFHTAKKLIQEGRINEKHILDLIN